MIKPIVVYMKRMRVAEKIAEKEQSQWTKGLEMLIEKICLTKNAGMQLLTETMEKKWSQEEKSSSSVRPLTMARVVKPAKVPS